MKTSVIEVHDMLAVWSVEEVEKRVGDVPGVASATVNFAAGSAAVRYDETRLAVADIKSAVRQRGYEAAEFPADSAGDGHVPVAEGHAAPGAPPATPATPAPEPKPSPDAAPVAPAAEDKQQDKTNEATASK